ncbi:unnamed protein product [Caenorhabditis sp. 36 PRJEB53466]|nr:unnamed protein product [Caenorhabditis sp. 36 PRJEB53466]
MSSDDEQSDENPMLARHRKEKKELRARNQAAKKSAKSGNKQRQKEVNAEIERSERELEERHQRELAEAAGPAPPPAEDAPSAAPLPHEAAREEGEDEDDEATSSCAQQFYKSLKMSKKSEKKLAKRKANAEKMANAEKADKEAANRKDTAKYCEKENIKKMLTEARLKMVEIPADGDCMYASIVHQLQEVGIETSVKHLRRECAEYLREHPLEFLDYLDDTDFGRGLVAAVESPLLFADRPSGPTVHEWNVYLRGVSQMAEVGGEWGGTVELTACANIFERTIVVYKDGGGGEEVLGGQFLSRQKKALSVVFLQKMYTLGEHYNSTTPM